MLAPVTHILPLTSVVRERVLPMPGSVLVRIGQKVAPGDAIAETTYAREHALIDVARLLGLSGDAADKLIKCKKGEKIAKGAVIAVGGGLFGNELTAPIDGRVVAVGGGQVLLERGEASIELKAGLAGVVTEVINDRGAVVRATGALIQGVWGNGRLDYGLMLNLAEKPDHVLSAMQLDVSLRGSVILAGHCDDAATLQAAAELPVRGLILASLAPSVVATAAQMRYPIIVTEGFGRRAMNATAYKLLSTNIKREAALNAEMDRTAGTRPEIVIALPISQEPPEPRDVETFAPGQAVRLRREPQAGAVGTLTGIKSNLVAMPSGIRVTAGDVRLENGETITVPLVNLEVLG